MAHALQEGEDETEPCSKHVEQKHGARCALDELPDTYMRECEHSLG
jgi:hypothetical protein